MIETLSKGDNKQIYSTERISSDAATCRPQQCFAARARQQTTNAQQGTIPLPSR